MSIKGITSATVLTWPGTVRHAAAALVGLLLLYAWCQPSWSQKNTGASAGDALVHDVLVVHQSSVNLGKTTLFLSAKAGRFVAHDGDLVIASSAPDWHIVIYSHKQNQGFMLTATQAKTESLGLFTSPLSINEGTVTQGHDALLRLDCTKVVTTAKSDLQTSRDAFFFQDRAKKQLLDSTAEIADPTKVPPGVQAFLSFVYNLRSRAGWLVELRTRYKDGSALTVLHTTSLEHTDKPASFFAYPTNFKKADNMVQILLSADATETLEDLWGSVPKKSKVSN